MNNSKNKNHHSLLIITLASSFTSLACSTSDVPPDDGPVTLTLGGSGEVETSSSSSGDGDGDGDDPVCGDGQVQGEEQCDDGNDDNTDDCTNACTEATCGDGITWAGNEECDDGNDDNADACVADCLASTCGDGFVQEGVESCDDGNDVDDDQCSNSCILASCGDGELQEGEQCDDGNDDNTDDCLDTCVAASCGDGFVWADDEECDGSDLGSAICSDLDPNLPFGTVSCNNLCELQFDCSNKGSFCLAPEDKQTPVAANAQVTVTIEVEIPNVIVADINVQITLLSEELFHLVSGVLDHEGLTSVSFWDQILDLEGDPCSGDNMSVLINDESPNLFECDPAKMFAVDWERKSGSEPLVAFDDLPVEGDWNFTLITGQNQASIEEVCLNFTAAAAP